MIGFDEFELYLLRRPDHVGRRAVIRRGDRAAVRIGHSRLVGRITHVDHSLDLTMIWVRVPMVDVPLPDPGLTSLAS